MYVVDPVTGSGNPNLNSSALRMGQTVIFRKFDFYPCSEKPWLLCCGLVFPPVINSITSAAGFEIYPVRPGLNVSSTIIAQHLRLNLRRAD
jgi:hypothetical protein